MEPQANNIPPQIPPPLPSGALSQPSPSPAASRRRFPARLVALVAGLVVVVPVICYVALAFYFGHAHPVLIVSGMDKPYAVSIDSRAYTLQPGENIVRIRLSEGTHSVRAAFPVPGVKVAPCNETFEIDTPFWTRPWRRAVVFINPDRLRIMADKNMFLVKYGDDTTAYTPEEGVHIYAGNVVTQLPMPDILHDERPPKISSGADKPAQMTWAGVLPAAPVAESVVLLEKMVNRKQAVAWLMRYGLLMPELGAPCRFANNYLTPAEADLFYKQHLETRPVQVVWHRSYQDYVRSQPPANVMNTYYRALLATNPTDGELLYVIGRGISRERNNDDMELYARSLRSDNPSPYAWYSLAGDAQDKTDYALALSRVRRAMAENVDIPEIREMEREILLALGRNEEAEESAKIEYNQNPLNFARATEYLALLGLNKKSANERDAAARKFEDMLGENMPYRYKADCNAVLQAAYAYGMGDEDKYCYELRRVAEIPQYAFNAALTRGNHKRAFEVLDTQMRANFTNWLLLYIVAREKGDETDATRYFAEALDAMRLSSRGARSIAKEITETGDISHETLIQSQFSPTTKPILFCALGWHSPAQRELYFYWANRMNVTPDFPRLLLTKNMQSANSFH